MKGRFSSVLAMFVFCVLVPIQVYATPAGSQAKDQAEPDKATLAETKDAPVQLPAEASGSWWASVQQDIRSSEYNVT